VKRVLLLVVVLFLSSCSQPRALPTLTSTPVSVTETMPPQPAPGSAVATDAARLEAGQWTYIFYHEVLHQVVLVNGGPEQGKPSEDPLELWSWDGSTWSLLSADEDGPTPVWRNWAATAYDSERDVLVIYSGLQDRKSLTDTWEWDGRKWTLYSGDGPGALEGALMAYDPVRGEMVLFGGSTPDLEIHGDTWAWDGKSWRQLSDTGPAARFPGGMVYDAARQEVLLYSGHFASVSGDFVNYDDLWNWDGAAWRESTPEGATPGHRTHAGLVYDPVTERVLLIGSGSGTFLKDVWAWDGVKWEEIPSADTPARSGQNIAYDPVRDRFVLFGGVDRPGGRALQDAWEWDRTMWTCADNC
jgi:hypothetical protein